MPRPVTLFTGQWADLSFPNLAEKAAEMGYDGLELACWGDHFDVDKAAISKKYCQERWEILSDHGLTCFAISSHLVGQAVCDLIDERHKAILPPDVWGDGDPKKVRKRAAKKLAKTAKACRNFINAKPDRKKKDDFPAVVNGFTGSSIWHSIYAFPPTDQAYWEKGFQDFAKRFGPILEEFEKHGVNFALEVHPTEIAFDIASAERALCIPSKTTSVLALIMTRLTWSAKGLIRQVHPNFFRPHLPCPHEGCVVGSWGWHGRRFRRSHDLCRPKETLGFSFGRPRRRRFRRNYRCLERHRIRRASFHRVGGQSHGSLSWSGRVMRIHQGS